MDNYQFPKEAYGATLTADGEFNGLMEAKSTYSKSAGLIVSPPADRVWMMCHRDDSNGMCYDFIDDEMLKLHKRAISRHNRSNGRSDAHIYPMSLLPKFWDVVGLISTHHGMKCDFPLVEKLLGYHMPREKRWDTLVQSQTQHCDRGYVAGSKSGPHAVESFALRLGKGTKVEHEDWMNFSVDMYVRCWRDVEIQCDILNYLNDEREKDRVECGINWEQALHTEHMAAFWISYSEQWGFPLDVQYAKSLVTQWDGRLAEIEDHLLPNMPFRLNFDKCGTKKNFDDYCESFVKNTELTREPLGWCWEEELGNRPLPVWKPFKKDGDYSANVIKFWATAYEDDAGLTEPPLVKMTHDDVAGAFTRIRWVNYNIGSNDQVIEYLTRYTKWEATEFTDKGNPSLTDDSFDSIGEDGLGAEIKEFLITKSRRTNLSNFTNPTKGLLNLVRPDERVTPRNNTIGTNTGRSRHSGIVNIPSGGALYGNEMRKCFTAYEGGHICGADLSSLEMRALAHEMEDEQCTKEIVDGDIHTVWKLAA